MSISKAFGDKLFLVITSNLWMLFLFSSIVRQPFLGSCSVGLCMVHCWITLAAFARNVCFEWRRC